MLIGIKSMRKARKTEPHETLSPAPQTPAR